MITSSIILASDMRNLRHDRVFRILRQVGFAGWISIEDCMDPQTGANDIAASAVCLRYKMREHGLV